MYFASQFNVLVSLSGGMITNGPSCRLAINAHQLENAFLITSTINHTLYVDISELVQRDSKTGIQRVVRSVVRILLEQGPRHFRVEFVHASTNEPYKFAHSYISELCGTRGSIRQDEIINPEDGDVFLGLDFQNTMAPSHAAFLRKIRLNGIRVYFVVYDLLPIQFKSYFVPPTFENHTRWLNVVAQSDGAICISKSVAVELMAWLQFNQPFRQKPFNVGWFHLGADVNASYPSRGLPPNAASTLQLFTERPTFLLVGTIEPRKGLTQVFAAFNALWQRGVDVNCVIVGKQGWLVDKLVADLKASPELGKRLFWLSGISDEFLEKVYVSSSCLIAASEGEGFGLPLIEAARHKLPILARDLPVFREIAGVHATYFEGLDPLALADALTYWLRLYHSGLAPQSHTMPARTWSESTAQLLDVVLNNKWYAQWTSNNYWRCMSSDPRMQTQAGVKVGESIDTAATEGFLLYGPYISLPKGEYKIRVNGQINKWGTQDARIEATVDGGNEVLATKTLRVGDHHGLIAEMRACISTYINDFEVRLWVPSDCEMRINSLEIFLEAVQ
jgi:glycosyltransferase involved in cell wall biosynthesis